jgi:hypothetical protein
VPDYNKDTSKGKKKRLTPLQGEDAVSDGTATGVGGERRRRKIDDMMEEVESGRKRKGQSTDSANRY